MEPGTSTHGSSAVVSLDTIKLKGQQLSSEEKGSAPLGQQVARSVVWIVVERWSSRILSLVVFAILSRLLSPSQFGLLALATSCAAILQVFVDSGFSKALVQRKALKPKDASTAFWTAVFLAVALYGLLFLIAPALGAAFDEPELAPVLRVIGLGLPIAALSLTPAALLERGFGFKQLSIRQFIGALSGATVGVGAALLGAGVWALVAQILATSAVSAATLWASTPWRPQLTFSLDSLRSLGVTGASILGIDLLTATQSNLDKFVVGAFFSTQELGYYFLAQRVGYILVELVTSIIARVALTTLSKVQDDPERLKRILGQLTFTSMAVGIPVFGLAAVCAPQLIATIFGPEWGRSIPILWVLAPSWVFTCVMYFDRSVFLAKGFPGTALFQSVLQSVVVVVLLILMVPFGIIGIAFSQWALLATWPTRLAALRRIAQIDVRAYVLQPLRPIVAISPMLVAILLLQTTSWASVPGSLATFALPVCLAAVAIYTGLLWIVAGEANRTVLLRLYRGGSGYFTSLVSRTKMRFRWS